MASEEDIRQANALLLAAPLAPGGWLKALAAMAEACGAGSGQIITLNGKGAIVSHWLTNVPEHAREDIEAFGLTNPGVNPRLRIGMRAKVLEAVADQDHVDGDARRRLPIYAEMFDRMDLSFNCQTVLLRGDDLLVRTSITRGWKAGPLENDDFRAFAALAPTAQAAARLQMALEATRVQSIVHAMEALGRAAFLLDETGRVIALSAEAEACVKSGEILMLKENRLTPTVAEDGPPLNAAMSRALAMSRGEPAPPSRPVVLRHADGGRHGLTIAFHPMPPQDTVLGRVPVVLATANGPRPPVEADILRQAYRLSRAEAEVALAVADGEMLERIAEVRSVSLATIRTQLQSAYVKMGVHRQSELAAAIRALS